MAYKEIQGSFVPTTGEPTPQRINKMATILNTKVTGFQTLTEFVNGRVWFPDPALTSSTAQSPTLRQEVCKTFNIGTLPAAAGTLTVAHGLTIDAYLSTTNIYGSATDPSTKFIPLPYASATAADVVEVWLDATNINIKVGKNMSGFTKTYLVVEWIAQ